MFSRKQTKWMKMIGAAAILRRHPMLGLAAAAAGGVYAYYKLRGRSSHDVSEDDTF